MRWTSFRNVLFLVGLFSVVLMILTLDVSVGDLCRGVVCMGWWLAAIIVLWLLLYVLNALAWLLILRESGPVPVSFLRLLKVTVSGFALNSATPVGLLGGEPYKIMELKPVVGAQRATSSVVLFSMMHVFSHFWFWLTGVALYVLLLPVHGGSLVLLGLVGAFCCIGIYLFVKGYKDGMLLHMLQWTSRLPGCRKWMQPFIAAHSDALRNVNQQIAALMGQSRRTFYLSLLLEYAGRMLQALEILAVLYVANHSFSGLTAYFDSVFILAFTSLFSNMLFFMPMQMGGREGGFALSCTTLGLAGGLGVLISIVTRLRELVWMLVGVAMIQIGKTSNNTTT